MRRLAIFVVVATTTACQVIIGIGDPPTSHTTAVSARGVVEPVEVRLVSAEIDETITVSADGTAYFSSRVLEGSSYAFSLAGTSSCVIADPAGVSTGDVTSSLLCSGVTRLVGLELSTATGVQPALVPTQLAYAMAVSELQQDTVVTAIAADDEATFTIAGEQLANGAASSPIDLAVGSTTISIVVDHPAGAVLRSTYTVDVTRSLALADHVYAKANPQSNDFLGQSVDVDGDTLVIGASGEGSLANPDDPSDQGAALSGTAYLFERDDQGAWRRVAFAKAPNANANDLFGYSVAVSGGLVVIGAPFESSASTTNTSDNSASHAGAAYVFRREGSQWVFEAYLKSPAPQANALFGWDVAIEGGVVVVGAPGTDDVASNSGEVFVFRRSGTVWSLDGELREDAAGQGGLGDGLGESVAISGQVIAAGAPNGEVAGAPLPNSGTVRLYSFGAAWTFDQELAASDPFTSASFGRSVAMAGTRLVAGASAVGVANQAGAAYVFSKVGGVWTFEQKLSADTPSSGDELGAAVDIAGDTIAIGAYRENGPGAELDPLNRTDTSTDSDAVYVFHASGFATWSQRHYLKSSHPGDGDWFGISLALSGDTLVVGAVGEDSGSSTDPDDQSASSAGACSVYR